jgi:hypothetical protein
VSEPDGGSDRATVALAVAKIDGLHALTRAEFGDVKDRLTKLEGLPERVVRLEATIGIYQALPGAVGGLERLGADHEHRLIAVERVQNAERASWSIHWPTLIPALLALGVALLALFLN